MKALKAQGMSRDDLPYKAPFQPYGSWFALIATAIITIFKGKLLGCCRILSPDHVADDPSTPGFDTFIPFTKDTFVTSYIAIPAFVIFWGGYKLFYRTRVIPVEKVDLITGKREIDEEEERFNAAQAAKGPRTTWQKIFDHF